MEKFLSRKFITILLAGIANMAVLFGAPENARDAVPQILLVIDSLVGLYVLVQGWIDKTGKGGPPK